MIERQIQEEWRGITEVLRDFVGFLRAPVRIEVYAIVLAAAAVALAAGLALGGMAGEVPFVPVAALAVVAWLAERQSVVLTSNAQMSVSVLPVLFAAVVYGPLAAMAVGACALLSDFGRPYTRWLVWTATRAIAAGLAGMAAASFGATNSLATLVVVVAVAGLVEAVTDIGLGALTLRVRQSGSALTTAAAMTRLVVGTIPLYTPVLATLAYAYREVSAWTVLLFFVPALAAQRLFVLYQEQRQLADDLVVANNRLESANLSFASALVATLDARDQYTAGHSAAVAIYARDIAARMGLAEGEQRLAHVAGLVHDIGKVGLPPGLLEKSGALTLEERRQMETHSIIGERILAKVEDYAEIARVVRHHHERVDGRGYPDGLAKHETPLVARIIGVADAYNAMTSHRPYREAMPSRVARLRLAQAVESQFDTDVVAAFEAILASSSEDYRMGTSPEFSFEAQEATTAGRVSRAA
jgi:putative nucleotidyltransferase with HDIG domain